MIETKTLSDSYLFYRETTDEKKPTPRKIYMEIVYGFIKYLVDMLMEGWEVELGVNGNVGTLQVIGRKRTAELDAQNNIKRLAPNWKETLALWNRNAEAKAQKKMVYYFNEGTNSITYKVFWSRMKLTVQDEKKKIMDIKLNQLRLANVQLYSFQLSNGTNSNKKRLVDLINSGKEYLIVNK